MLLLDTSPPPDHDESQNKTVLNEDIAKFMGTFGNMNYNGEDQTICGSSIEAENNTATT